MYVQTYMAIKADSILFYSILLRLVDCRLISLS